MELRLFLKEDYSTAFHKHSLPHCGEHSKTYVDIAVSMALVNEIVETPYFELCLQQFKKIDTGDRIHDVIYEELGFFELDTEFTPYASHLKKLYKTIEKGKKKIIRYLQTLFETMPDNFLSLLKKKIQAFHEKKDKVCKSTLYELEYLIEKRRLDKIMTSLLSSAP